MYFSQNAILLVLLTFIVSSIFYLTMDVKSQSVADLIKIKKTSLEIENIKSSVEHNLDSYLVDAFNNASYYVVKHGYFDNYYEAKRYIENLTLEHLNKTIQNISNISYEINSLDIEPTNDPLVYKVNLNLTITYYKDLDNAQIFGYKTFNINKDVKLSYIPDPYLLLNKDKVWKYYVNVTVHNFPDDNNNHTFYIKLTPQNFNYNHMFNRSSPNEIRVVGVNYTLLNYWVQDWNPDGTSIIWVRANKNQLINGNTLKILYGANISESKENPKNTFIFFDGFDNYPLNSSLWD
ncbi:DUF2341 domain-containing protein, partial [Methanocaldococcus sp.]